MAWGWTQFEGTTNRLLSCFPISWIHPVTTGVTEERRVKTMVSTRWGLPAVITSHILPRSLLLRSYGVIFHSKPVHPEFKPRHTAWVWALKHRASLLRGRKGGVELNTCVCPPYLVVYVLPALMLLEASRGSHNPCVQPWPPSRSSEHYGWLIWNGL
jgi:hypothetical protein